MFNQLDANTAYVIVHRGELSDYDMLTAALDIVSNHVLLQRIMSMVPVYSVESPWSNNPSDTLTLSIKY